MGHRTDHSRPIPKTRAQAIANDEALAALLPKNEDFTSKAAAWLWNCDSRLAKKRLNLLRSSGLIILKDDRKTWRRSDV